MFFLHNSVFIPDLLGIIHDAPLLVNWLIFPHLGVMSLILDLWTLASTPASPRFLWENSAAMEIENLQALWSERSRRRKKEQFVESNTSTSVYPM